MATNGDRLDKDDRVSERVTLRVPDDMLALVEEAVDGGRFNTRSEAIRHCIRAEFGGVDDV